MPTRLEEKRNTASQQAGPASGARAKRIPAADAKARFAECLRTAEKGQAIIITRHGKDVAAIIPAEELSRMERTKASDDPKLGLAGLIGGWQGSEELYRILKRIKRSPPRNLARLD